MSRFSPKADRALPWVEIRREVRCDELEIKLPTDNSYISSIEECKLFLLQLGMPELMREKAIDLVWNCYAIKIEIQDNFRYYPIMPTKYPDGIGQKSLDAFNWIF